MTKDEMQRVVALNTTSFNEMKAILDAVDAYLSASNTSKPTVSEAVCPCNELPDGEIAISSKALQKPYGDLGQTDG